MTSRSSVIMRTFQCYKAREMFTYSVKLYYVMRSHKLTQDIVLANIPLTLCMNITHHIMNNNIEYLE